MTVGVGVEARDVRPVTCERAVASATSEDGEGGWDGGGGDGVGDGGGSVAETRVTDELEVATEVVKSTKEMVKSIRGETGGAFAL